MKPNKKISAAIAADVLRVSLNHHGKSLGRFISPPQRLPREEIELTVHRVF